MTVHGVGAEHQLPRRSRRRWPLGGPASAPPARAGQLAQLGAAALRRPAPPCGCARRVHGARPRRPVRRARRRRFARARSKPSRAAFASRAVASSRPNAASAVARSSRASAVSYGAADRGRGRPRPPAPAAPPRPALRPEPARRRSGGRGRSGRACGRPATTPSSRASAARAASRLAQPARARASSSSAGTWSNWPAERRRIRSADLGGVAGLALLQGQRSQPGQRHRVGAGPLEQRPRLLGPPLAQPQLAQAHQPPGASPGGSLPAPQPVGQLLPRPAATRPARSARRRRRCRQTPITCRQSSLRRPRASPRTTR